MTTIQWIRHINRLCDLRGDARFDDIFLDCIAAMHRTGRTSVNQGNWLVTQLDMHYGIQLTHIGPIHLTKPQHRIVKEAVAAAVSVADKTRRAVLSAKFPHVFRTGSTTFPQVFRTKGAISLADPTTYDAAIARLLLKLIDAPLAFSWPSASTDGLSAQVDGGSPAARHQITEAALPIAVNTNVIDDAASPLRGFAAKSDEPFHQGKDPKTANANSPMINGRVDVWLLAKNMGTSVEMIRKHYGQDEPQQRSEELTHDKQQLDMKTWIAMLTENPAMAEALLRKVPEGPIFDPDAPEAEPDPNVPRRRAKIRLSDMLD